MLTGFLIAMGTALVLFIAGWALSNIGIDNHKQDEDK